jgi:hypothetical protein
MPSARHVTAAPAVLFVLIGWGRRYDGTETIEGGHGYLAEHGDDCFEAKAFVRRRSNYYSCGIGKGAVNEDDLDVVFVARDPKSGAYRIVALYRNVEIRGNEGSVPWPSVRSRTVRLFKPDRRPVVDGWPAGRQFRRWARRSNGRGRSWPGLLRDYHEIVGRRAKEALVPDVELEWFEGEQQARFVKHRRRELRGRKAKILEALRNNKGRLPCEVPGCGFDFQKVYGSLGAGFAIVHHKRSLASLDKDGDVISTKDLAIVCANCHAMIHKGGQCREMDKIR